MTDIPRPAAGDVTWTDWADDEETQSDAVAAATSVATVSTLVKRDAAGRFRAVDGTNAGDVVTKAQLDTKVTRQFTKNTITGAYTLVAADATDIVLHTTAATGLTITLPQDSAATIGQEIAIPWRQYGAGQITFAAGTGATLVSRGSVFKSAGQNAEGTLTKVGVSAWLLSGDIVA